MKVQLKYICNTQFWGKRNLYVSLQQSLKEVSSGCVTTFVVKYCHPVRGKLGYIFPSTNVFPCTYIPLHKNLFHPISETRKYPLSKYLSIICTEKYNFFNAYTWLLILVWAGQVIYLYQEIWWWMWQNIFFFEIEIK